MTNEEIQKRIAKAGNDEVARAQKWIQSAMNCVDWLESHGSTDFSAGFQTKYNGFDVYVQSVVISASLRSASVVLRPMMSNEDIGGGIGNMLTIDFTKN